MNEFINEHILPHFGTFISAVLTGLAGFIFGKRKQTAEVEGINADNEGKEIENAENVLKYYRAMVDDLGEKLITAIKELDEAKRCKGHCKSVRMDSLDITNMDGIRDSITINR
mgnify:CR=1 FL=1